MKCYLRGREDDFRCGDLILFSCVSQYGFSLCYSSLREQPSRRLWNKPGSPKTEQKLRVLSHLARCFRTWHVSPLSSVRLDIQYVNTAIGLGSGTRSPERGGLSSITNELWSGSVAVRKQSDPGCTHCIMGKYVSSVKSRGCARLHHSKSKHAF